MKTHFALLAFALNAGCMSPELESETVDRNMAAPETATQAEAEAAAEPLMLTASGDAYPEELLPRGRAWTGDFDGMIERRVIRAVVTVSLTGYFLDGATQRGITYDALQAFEKALNEKLNTGNLKVHVAIIPVARDQLRSWTAEPILPPPISRSLRSVRSSSTSRKRDGRA